SYHERRDRLARTCGYLAYLPLDGIGPSPRRPLHRPRPRPRTDRGLAATPHSEPDLTPRTSLRAEQRACAPLFQGTSFPHLKWLRLPDQKWLWILDRSQVSGFRDVPSGNISP